MTQQYALFGTPIEHSPSPAMHNAGFAALGLDARYRLRPADVPQTADIMGEMHEGRWRGANVTTPLKTHVAKHVPLQGGAARAGAVNTLWHDGARLVGSLTDIEGIAGPLRQHGYTGGGRCLLIGAGGAARAALLALDSLGGDVVVAARDSQRAEALISAVTVQAKTGTVAISLDDTLAVSDVMATAEVIVQATPVGRQGERHALPWKRAPAGAVAFDMTYLPKGTAFLSEAVAVGYEAIYGWEMLWGQGVASFELWTGEPAPQQAMKDALLNTMDDA